VPDDFIDAEVVEEDDQRSPLDKVADWVDSDEGRAAARHAVPIDAEVVEEEPGTDLIPVEPRDVQVVGGVAAPTGPDLCWWRLGPNIRERTKFAHDYGVFDVEEPDGPGVLTLIWRDGYRVSCPVAGHFAEWNHVEVREGFSDRAEDTVHHVKLMYIDILVQRPPALPDPTPWQQMTRHGDIRYPGTAMENWAFNDPWEDTPAGFYPRYDTSDWRNRWAGKAPKIGAETSAIDAARRELE
jgi:hypothetical protein